MTITLEPIALFIALIIWIAVYLIQRDHRRKKQRVDHIASMVMAAMLSTQAFGKDYKELDLNYFAERSQVAALILIEWLDDKKDQ